MVWQFVATTLVVVAVVLLPFVLLYLRRRWLTGQGGLELDPGRGERARH